jgi:fructosamine-3-kinase
MKDDWSVLARHIAVATGEGFVIRQRHALGGGCINQAYSVSDGKTQFFVKLNAESRLAMFEAEAAGLEALAATAALRVPRPICCGIAASGESYLVLEYLQLGAKTTAGMALMGRQLATLHSVKQPYFGWPQENTLGSTRQPNGRFQDWVGFWRDQRLGFQLDLAATNGYRGVLQKQGEKLQSKLAQLFGGYQPTPALLHGDLWSGNVGCTSMGEPIIFDPAVYYGDCETDLAMTELFGGFPEQFYAAYRERAPLAVGYPQRRTLYNLYHILNHLNLFGGTYQAQAERMMTQLLAELAY